MKRIIIVGSINMDVVALTAHLPKPGETVSGHDLHFIPGGKGSNQAVAASRVGGQVKLVCKLGKDSSGEALLAFLKNENLDLGNLMISDEAPTGTAIIVVDQQSENTIVVIPGTNGKITVEEIKQLEINTNDLILSQFEIPQPVIQAVFQKARAVGATTLLNPTPAAATSSELLALVDYLIVNETELAFYAGSDIIPENPAEIAALAQEWRTRDDQHILITLGSKGVLCVGQAGVLQVAAHQVQAVDTTGAGDCFVGAFATALSEGKALQVSLEFANAAAALSVQRLGASASMPTRAEVDQFSAAS